MKTRCLIVDDEPLAIEIIETHLSQLDDFIIVGTCKNAIEAFQVLEKETIDLMFLDIQMPKITGIDFLKSLQHRPKVIFTTAFIDYAIEGYELDVVDYLVKPISFERFFKAISKYKNLVDQRQAPITTAKTIEQDYIYVKSNKKRHRLLFDSIWYVESVKDYVRIHLEDKSLIVKTTLTHFESQLPSNIFLRIHRSYIVNLSKVTAHTHNDIELSKMEIPIGNSYKQKVFELLK